MAQMVHAAGESSPGNLKPGTYAVALAASSERELADLADRLEAAGEPVHRVVESHGRYAGQLMAIGLEPGPKSERGRLLSHLPLLRWSSFLESTQRQEEMQRRLRQYREQHYCRIQSTLWGTIWEAIRRWRSR